MLGAPTTDGNDRAACADAENRGLSECPKEDRCRFVARGQQGLRACVTQTPHARRPFGRPLKLGVVLKRSRVAFVLREEFRHEVAQAVEVYRLGEVAVEAGVEGGLAEAVRVEGRERDDGHALKL